MHEGVELGFHQDGCQDAEVAPDCEQVGKEEDGKRMDCSRMFSVRPRRMNSVTVVLFSKAPGSMDYGGEL